jgi:hypothetical protein
MSTSAVPRITTGMTLAVEQTDYLYGTGTALLIVQSITVDQRILPSLEWVLLHCVRLRHDGSVLGPFSPLVRVSTLATAARPTGWLPTATGVSSPPVASPDRGRARPVTGQRHVGRPGEFHCPNPAPGQA